MCLIVVSRPTSGGPAFGHVSLGAKDIQKGDRFHHHLARERLPDPRSMRGQFVIDGASPATANLVLLEPLAVCGDRWC